MEDDPPNTQDIARLPSPGYYFDMEDDPPNIKNLARQPSFEYNLNMEDDPPNIKNLARQPSFEYNLNIVDDPLTIQDLAGRLRSSCNLVEEDDPLYMYPIANVRPDIFNHEETFDDSHLSDEINPDMLESDINFKDADDSSLHAHLQNQDKLSFITWEQRLNICIGVARELNDLHSGTLQQKIVVNRLESRNILLDENMKATIGGSVHWITVSNKQTQVYDEEIDPTLYEPYMDPIYTDSHMANVEADVYSFGYLMFEVLSGSLDNTIDKIHRSYDEGLHKMIDPCIRDHIGDPSLHIFAETAFRCLSFNVKERPSAYRIVKKIEEALHIHKHRSSDSTTTRQSHHFQKLEDLLIPLNEINLATGDFDENYKIGEGGFGVVYKGQLSKQWSNDEVAIKRLNKTGHQVKTDFLNELNLISRFHHPNIIRFIGYCSDGDEMILVYECANNGSLESHLEKKNKKPLLTWVQRLKICLGAARGLEYLHSGLGEDNRVIHRDVKSGNILLDCNLEAKICDFGFSKSAFSNNMQQSKLYTKIAGTNYYMDPVYHESGILRTESDVYSFGVVMFEMLTGMLAWYTREIEDGKQQLLINLVRRYYDQGKELLTDPKIKDQVDKSSFNKFIEIAYECISMNSKERPTMVKIVDKIEEALDLQIATGLRNEERHKEAASDPNF